MVIPLCYLEENQTARIVWMALSPDIQQQVNHLGFKPEEPVTCVLKNRRGSIAAYQLRHSVIALRASTASGILVKLPETE